MSAQLRGHKIGRNSLCPCGSGLKYKFCHGDLAKALICKNAANEKMLELIQKQKIKKQNNKITKKEKDEKISDNIC